MCHHTRGRPAALAAALLAAAGCTPGGPSDPPGLVRIRGTVEFKGGQVAQLAGAVAEFESAADPAVRARGPVEDDGSFEAVVFKDGRSLGVPAGTYRARVLPPPEADARGREVFVFDRKYADFKLSGLTVTANGTDPVKLTVEKTR